LYSHFTCLPQTDPNSRGFIKRKLVIHHIPNFALGVAELPSVVLGQIPPPRDATATQNFGSGNYGKRPVAIIVGGLYTDSDVAGMRDVILKEAGPRGLEIPWLRVDMSVPHASPTEDGAAYAAEVGRRAKARLGEVLGSGEGRDGGIFWY